MSSLGGFQNRYFLIINHLAVSINSIDFYCLLNEFDFSLLRKLVNIMVADLKFRHSEQFH